MMKENRKCRYCGECCKKNICTFGKIFLRIFEPPCTGLIIENDYFTCCLLIDTEKYVFPKLGLRAEQYNLIRQFIKENINMGGYCNKED